MIDISKIYQSKKCGNFKVVNYKGYKDVTIEFIDTGTVKNVTSADIRRGFIKDNLHPSLFGVGCIGYGTYNTSHKGKETREYVAWAGMIRRCYSRKRQEEIPTYKGCSVCAEWHNFQNFAEWYETNHPKDGKKYELDKDIKIKGNKIYSPDTCMLVSRAENTIAAMAKHYSFISPDGSVVNIYNLHKFCKGKDLCHRSMGAVHAGKSNSHKGWTAYCKRLDKESIK